MTNSRILAAAAALAIASITAAPSTANAEPTVAAQFRLSFGTDKPRLSLGLGATEERPSAGPQRARPITYRPLLEVSARFSTSYRQLEDLRLNGLPIGKQASAANENEKGNGGSRNTVAIGLAAVAVGVLVFSYVLVDDVTDTIVDAIDDS